MEKIDDFQLNMFQGCEISYILETESKENLSHVINGMVYFLNSVSAIKIERCKPILKTFEHLDPDDLKHLAFLAFGLANEYDKKGFNVTKGEIESSVEYNRTTFVIYKSLSFICAGSESYDIVQNNAEIISYLIENHFDVFGWVNADLAIKKEV